LLAAINSAKSFLESTVPAIGKSYKRPESGHLTYQYAKASPAKPLDLTYKSQTPHLLIIQALADKCRNGKLQLVEFYQKTFDMYQEISNLPAEFTD
jgi:hypothetical protein